MGSPLSEKGVTRDSSVGQEKCGDSSKLIGPQSHLPQVLGAAPANSAESE